MVRARHDSYVAQAEGQDDWLDSTRTDKGGQQGNRGEGRGGDQGEDCRRTGSGGAWRGRPREPAAQQRAAATRDRKQTSRQPQREAKPLCSLPSKGLRICQRGAVYCLTAAAWAKAQQRTTGVGVHVSGRRANEGGEDGICITKALTVSEIISIKQS